MKDRNHLQIGKIGEEAASAYLKRRGYEIIDRNYRRPWGELDIIAKKGAVVHFVEVKATSDVGSKPRYRAEEHVDKRKIARLRRIIQTYLARHPHDEWRFDVAVVRIDLSSRTIRIRFMEDLLLG